MSWEALFARRTGGVRLGIDHILPVWRAMGEPGRGRPVLHVVGTNGKGSTAALAAHALSRVGRRVGLYTSPHLVHVGERVRIGGEPVDDAVLERAVEHVLTFEAEAPGERPLSFFEVLTLAALDVFATSEVEVLVLEAGLGGRLDATRIVPPAVHAITRIARDHEAWLGSSLAAIAGEKAAVMREGVPAVSAPQVPEVAGVLAATAARVGAPLAWVEPLPRAPAGLTGAHQRENGAVALAAARVLDGAVAPEHLDGVQWPARLERLATRGGHVVLDVAHNPDGIAALCRHAGTSTTDSGVPQVVVFGCMRDKDGHAMVDELRRLGHPLWLVPPPADGAAAVETFGAGGEGDRRFAGVGELWGELETHLRAGGTAWVCGSHFLVGAVRAWAVSGSTVAPDPGDPLPRA